MADNLKGVLTGYLQRLLAWIAWMWEQGCSQPDSNVPIRCSPPLLLHLNTHSHSSNLTQKYLGQFSSKWALSFMLGWESYLSLKVVQVCSIMCHFKGLGIIADFDDAWGNHSWNRGSRQVGVDCIHLLSGWCSKEVGQNCILHIHPQNHGHAAGTWGQPRVCKHTTKVQLGSQLFNDSFLPSTFFRHRTL